MRPGVRCPTGEARLTPGFRLPARYVIHTVGPVWRGGQAGEPELLAGCYRSSLALAVQHEVRSIAFPAISCGVYRFPAEHAAEIAAAEISHFLTKKPTIDRVVMVAFEPDIYRSLDKAITNSIATE